MGDRGPKPRLGDHLDLAVRLADTPMTAAEVQARYAISPRTAYRWLALLEDQGHVLVRQRTPRGLGWRILADLRRGR